MCAIVINNGSGLKKFNANVFLYLQVSYFFNFVENYALRPPARAINMTEAAVRDALAYDMTRLFITLVC